REPAADHDGAIGHVVARPGVAAFRRVVEPVDEGVLVEEAPSDVAIGTLDRKRTVAPRTVREDDRREAPAPGQVLELDGPPDARVRHVVHTGTIETRVDRLVLLLPQLHVPARQPVLDLAIGTRVLLENDGGDAAGGEHAGGHGPGSGSPHDGHHILGSVRHATWQNTGRDRRGNSALTLPRDADNRPAMATPSGPVAVLCSGGLDSAVLLVEMARESGRAV